MKVMRPLFLLVMSISLMSSCTSQLDPVKFNELPKPSGMYGGSVLYDPWVYRGTDDRGNHFTYTWNRNNFTYDSELIASSETIPTDARFNLTTNRKEWKAASPILNEDGQLTSFKITPTIWERLAEKPGIFQKY